MGVRGKNITQRKVKMNDTKTNRVKLARKINRVNKELGIPSSKTKTMTDIYNVDELCEILDQKRVLLNFKVRRGYCG